MQRRLMPSLSELVAFEAVARLSSITAAAEELALTQGALSKQIRQLEATLGLELFERGHRHVRITPNGEAYVDEIRPILKRLERATHGVISANRKVETLALGVLPAFSSCWLAPRLAGFAAENPTVTVHCHTYLQPFDFEKETFDAAIHIGHDNWSGTRAYRLFGEDIVAVASPE
jgi:DNA-binding transcriptional LysR family regulator